MKKLISSLIALAMIVSCSKSEQPELNGNVALNIGKETGAFVDVKSGTKAASPIADTYKIETVNSQNNQESAGTGLYSAIKQGFNLRAGSGYKMSAFNITEAEAESLNEGKGEARYFGTSTFNVVAGETANVSFICTMANSQVAVAYDETFTSQFVDYSVELSTQVNTGRVVVFPSTADLTAPIAFFNVDSVNPILNIVIKGTRKLDSQAKSFTQTINLAAKTWHKLTIKATSVSGSVGVDITVDNTIAEISSDVNIDPYN